MDLRSYMGTLNRHRKLRARRGRTRWVEVEETSNAWKSSTSAGPFTVSPRYCPRCLQTPFLTCDIFAMQGLTGSIIAMPRDITRISSVFVSLPRVKQEPSSSFDRYTALHGIIARPMLAHWRTADGRSGSTAREHEGLVERVASIGTWTGTSGTMRRAITAAKASGSGDVGE